MPFLFCSVLLLDERTSRLPIFLIYLANTDLKTDCERPGLVQDRVNIKKNTPEQSIEPTTLRACNLLSKYIYFVFTYIYLLLHID